MLTHLSCLWNPASVVCVGTFDASQGMIPAAREREHVRFWEAVGEREGGRERERERKSERGILNEGNTRTCV